MSLKSINSNAKKTDFFLRKFLEKQNKSGLINSMKYGSLSGGKKIRSSIIISTGKLFNLNIRQLINICAAVECIHSYSLIHDDLPCMDNDSIRRGKPATHIKFGESTAILAGNSLLTLAFEIISNTKYKIKEIAKVKLIKELANCSGHTGIAGGQYLDLNYEKKKKSFNQIIEMQRKKTGKLFNFCCLSVGIVANKNTKEQKFLSKLGEDIGLLFQLADDFIDIKGSQKLTGKPTKKDKKKGKSTLISLIGLKKTNNFAINLQKNILRKLNRYGTRSLELSSIVKFILERKF